jgi:hypothetical protein
MIITITDIAAIFGFLIAILDLILIIYDRRPHVKVHITAEDIIEEVGPNQESARTGKHLWVHISNYSTKKIWISTLNVEWSWYPDLPLRIYKMDIQELQRYENNIPLPTTRFWVDVWGDVMLDSDAEVIERDLDHKIYEQRRWLNYYRKIHYQVVVYDGLGIAYRSNKIRLYMPPFKG